MCNALNLTEQMFLPYNWFIKTIDIDIDIAVVEM